MAGGDGHPNDLLDELARARVLVPLPTGPPGKRSGSVDVTFSGESAPDVVDEWVAGHARPFHIHDDR